MQSLLKVLTFIAVSHLFSFQVLSQNLEKAWETVTEFQGPESVLYDEKRNIVFVSNVNGAPDQEDGNGFISILKLDGSIVNLNWVSGLNGPKGLALSGNKLYVADINTLVEINVDNGSILNRYKAAEAKFLNDVAIDESNNVYVSDMFTNTIYRLNAGKFDVWLKSDKLQHPNGLYVNGKQLIVGSWGRIVDGFSTDVLGHLKSVSLDNSTVKTLGNGNPVGNLDGIVQNGDDYYYATDWMSGGLFNIDTTGKASKILTLEQGSADLDFIANQGLILIPMMLQNKVLAYKVK